LGFGSKRNLKDVKEGGAEPGAEIDFATQAADADREIHSLQQQLETIHKDKDLVIEGLNAKVTHLETALAERSTELEKAREEARMLGMAGTSSSLTSATSGNATSPESVKKLETELSSLKTRLELAVAARLAAEDKVRDATAKALVAEEKTE